MLNEFLIDERLADEAAFAAFNEVYVAELEARTPKSTRETSVSWKARKIQPFLYEVYNTATTDDGKIALVLLLEEGTKPHIITPKNKKSLHWQEGTKDVFAKKVRHPGFKGRFFVKSVINDQTLYENFVRVFLDYLARALT